MGDFLSVIGVIAGFFVLLGACWLAMWKFGLLNKGADTVESQALEDGERSPQYRARDHVMSPGERSFFPVLKEAARLLAEARQAPPPLVLASVRLAEVIAPVAKRFEKGSGYTGAFNRISAKQVDFVLCEPETTRPLLVVELDDKTHNEEDRKDRDDKVDEACQSAGMPILHIKTAAGYDAKSIAREMDRVMGTKRR